ncbi:MAG: hypothetical protein IKH51_09210 [Clostridia bacterium]|nr:hypothetical protein [Clostridia bacterium]
MKKNWTMRVALLIVALALITSCFVSGTYAKYITSADADDTARVAKFGVVITSSGTLFDVNYKSVANGNTPTDTTTGITVKSSNGDKLVAPGTKNDEGITFTVTGQPEVDVAVRMSLGEELKEVFLKAGTYADMTTAADDDTFTLANDYYPVVFTLKIGTGSTATTYTGTLASIKDQLENGGAFASVYPAGTNLATAIGTITLTWEWTFVTNNVPAETPDFADTLLGDLAAGTTILPAANAPAAANYNLSEVVDISLNIVQVD